MLSLVGLSKRFGSQTVLDGVDWMLGSGDRIGLVGANGSGKSTLLRIIAGVVRADSGDVRLARGCTTGYLPQEIVGMSGKAVVDLAMEAFAEVRKLEDRCRDLEAALETAKPGCAESEAILEEYTKVREEFDRKASWDLRSRAEEVLMGLGFRVEDFSRDVGELSGGWQMRAALARLLLLGPDVLLLDEPTNHLDLDARNWLEDFLRAYEGIVILVAHDRYFLDVTVNRIVEVDRGRLVEYRANYTRYETMKAERIELERHAWETQQAEIERMENFIRKFRYQASKAKLVQSRIKQLDKLEKLEPPVGTREFHFRLPKAPRSGRRVLSLENATLRYGDLAVYEDLDFSVERGERVALVGPNGAGKTTLVRMLAGDLELSAGSRSEGHEVAFGYFAQDQASILDPKKSVLEEITAIAPLDMVPRLREILGAFLFSGEAVHKKTSVLSGGERNRLALAKLLLRQTNCLLLDEPTNHLDIHAKDVLLEALQHYQGAIVLVSHDRYILDSLPTSVVEVGRKRAVRYIGNYEDYLAKKALEAAEAETDRETPSVAAPAKPKEPSERKPEREGKRKGGPPPEKITAEIEAAESEQAELTEILSRPDFYQTHPDPHDVMSRYEATKQRIAELYGRLEEVLG